VGRSPRPVTVDSTAADLRELELREGDTVLVHASLSALGWVDGGPVTVVDALQRVVVESGTSVMPTHSPGVSNPEWWESPPVPDDWYGEVRETMPAYRPEVTPTRGMGAVVETFRSYLGVRRSGHPIHSFAAWGEDAEYVSEGHALDRSLGEDSPLARVNDLDGRVLFLGTTHAPTTSLHLAEYRADLEMETVEHKSPVLRDGEREWVAFKKWGIDTEDFPECGTAFEDVHPGRVVRWQVGEANAAVMRQRALADFGVEWFEANR